MTAHPIDTKALSKRAGHILFTEGPEQPAATAREVCVLLDLLAAAEARAPRAEAQSGARRISLGYWEARAREAEAERDRNLRNSREAKRRAIRAEARIKAVRDILDRSRDDTTMHTYPEELNADIRRALEA